MSKSEALEILSRAPQDDIASAVNAGITQKQAVEIVRRAVEAMADGEQCKDFIEKRVRQMAHPRYARKYL